MVMKIPRRRFLHSAASAAALPAASRIARAQSYPSRPITITVPFVAGGATDVIARIFAERLRASLGQTVVVENVSGAAGVLGVGRVARAPADGYLRRHAAGLAVDVQEKSLAGSSALEPSRFHSRRLRNNAAVFL
jgi:tripartite-type tricarboxylate transporter receptor subunit TctC